MRRVVFMMIAGAALPACEQVKRIDGGTGACVPTEVQAAFDRSCGGAACHTAGGMAGGLSLAAGQSGDAIGRAATGSPLPQIELGNTAGSYLAQKIMDNPTVTITGDRMPQGFQSSNAAQVEDINTILTWIAGGVFDCAAAETGGTSDSGGTSDPTGAAVQACGIEDLKPGAPNPIVSGTDPMQIPPDIATILADNCGCHFADGLTVMGVADYPSSLPFKMDTLAGFLATNPGGTPYHAVTLNRVSAEVAPMPSEPFCNVGDGEGMPPDERATLIDWLTAEAPDCTTWTGCAAEMIQACGIEDLKPGAPNPIVSGSGADQIPTDIATILAGNCGCHFVDMPTADVTDYQGVQDLSTIAGFQAPFNMAGDPLHELALTYVMTEFMPFAASCNIGGGEGMPPADRAVLVQWLTEGAPDGATWMP
jgi:hypothetical protein